MVVQITQETSVFCGGWIGLDGYNAHTLFAQRLSTLLREGRKSFSDSFTHEWIFDF